jgi:hypothetical protein
VVIVGIWRELFFWVVVVSTIVISVEGNIWFTVVVGPDSWSWLVIEVVVSWFIINVVVTEWRGFAFLGVSVCIVIIVVEIGRRKFEVVSPNRWGWLILDE